MSHVFGGSWTDQKLTVLERYLNAYVDVFKNQSWCSTVYMDAFAGTGYRVHTQDYSPTEDEIKSTQGMFIEPEICPEDQELLDGSARLALHCDPPFDRYVFIEKNAVRYQKLQILRDQFPTRNITTHKGDANAYIQNICNRGNWSKTRGVLFLDPYGMQVEWKTLEAIAATKAIDLWILFPLGIGVNRLLKRSGDIPDSWRRSLDRLFGTKEWYDEFYRVESIQDLFGEEEKYITKVDIRTIARYFNKRLRSIFAGVSSQPAILRNSSNNPLYLFCFAVGNERGKTPALEIANHILKNNQFDPLHVKKTSK